jgi:hypothetical protein
MLRRRPSRPVVFAGDRTNPRWVDPVSQRAVERLDHCVGGRFAQLDQADRDDDGWDVLDWKLIRWDEYAADVDHGAGVSLSGLVIAQRHVDRVVAGEAVEVMEPCGRSVRGDAPSRQHGDHHLLVPRRRRRPAGHHPLSVSSPRLRGDEGVLPSPTDVLAYLSGCRGTVLSGHEGMSVEVLSRLFHHLQRGTANRRKRKLISRQNLL